jgi:hypothetical protein
MDFTAIVNELRSASLFDLFRLSAAISQLLDDPARIAQVKAQLAPGMKITFFSTTTNRLEAATVLELRRTQLLVRLESDGARWLIHFGSVNVENVDADLRSSPRQTGLDRSRLKVGDAVGYTAQSGQACFGVVIRLNQKTATVRLTDGAIWRVGYEHLFPVIHGEVSAAPRELGAVTIDAEV